MAPDTADTSDTPALVQALRGALQAQAQPQQAPAMQAYMKSAMPFLGIATPQRRRTVAEVAAVHPMAESSGLSMPRFEREFFIRKGMGWALRERSYAAPEEVRAFCDAYRAQLSPLTVREALKVITKRSLTS